MNLLSPSEHLQPAQTFQRVTRANVEAENSDCLSVGDAKFDAALGVTLRTGQIIQLSVRGDPMCSKDVLLGSAGRWEDADGDADDSPGKLKSDASWTLACILDAAVCLSP